MTCAREAAVREADARVDDPTARDVLRLWDASQSQWRIGFSGPTGLDYVAVWKVVAPTLSVPRSELAFRLFQRLEGDQLSEWAAEAKRKREAEAAASAANRSRMR